MSLDVRKLLNGLSAREVDLLDRGRLGHHAGHARQPNQVHRDPVENVVGGDSLEQARQVLLSELAALDVDVLEKKPLRLGSPALAHARGVNQHGPAIFALD